MKQFERIPKIADLDVTKQTGEMTLYESFIMVNPKTKTTFPESDELYYKALELQLVHLIYKFKKGWISSERQVIYSSDECIATVHFLFDSEKNVTQINVFQRSSNLFNLVDDVQFFNYFIKEHLDNPQEVELNILVSMPHLFNNKIKKIED